MDYRHVMETDPELFKAIADEVQRQREHIELIASENFVSPAVMEAMGSPLTNKYAEGYPAKRYYGGCQYVDVAENLARDRAKLLFGAEHANVQPHSGAQANTAVYFAMLNPGDTVLGMNLSHGGHLTHGSPVNFSGRLFNVVSYGVDKDTCLIDHLGCVADIGRVEQQHRQYGNGNGCVNEIRLHFAVLWIGVVHNIAHDRVVNGIPHPRQQHQQQHK